ncbi:hypothetical protein P4S72_01160 [Vibrio sp. PP-XX7]
MDGTRKSTNYWGGLKDGVLQIVSVNPLLPNKIKQAIQTTQDKIIAGSIVPFAGPLSDNQGHLKVKSRHLSIRSRTEQYALVCARH